MRADAETRMRSNARTDAHARTRTHTSLCMTGMSLFDASRRKINRLPESCAYCVLRGQKMLMRTEGEGVWSMKKKDVNVNRG